MQKRALIVGGTSGIGLAAAKLLLEKGIRVAVIGRDGDKAKAAEAELQAHAREHGTASGGGNRTESSSGGDEPRPGSGAIVREPASRQATEAGNEPAAGSAFPGQHPVSAFGTGGEPESAVVRAFVGDASDRAGLEAIFAELAASWETLDILVHVAGISGRRWGDGPLHECTEEGWNVVMSNNVTGVYHSNQLALKMMKQQRSGSIVNISSILGMLGAQDHFVTHAYAASRGAVISMSRSAAVYYAKDGIRINVVCPGLLDTPMSQRAVNSEEIREALTYYQPLAPHVGYPQDVASAIAFLASDEAKFITGITLPVDGGWLAQ